MLNRKKQKRDQKNRANMLFSQLKLWSFGWRFIFIASLLFSVIAGTDFLSFVFKSIRAEKDQIQTINFYVETVDVQEETLDPGSGWWQAENLKANPELGPEAEVEEFDNTNSIFYSGGNYSIVLKDFALLKLEDTTKSVSPPYEGGEQEGVNGSVINIEDYEELISDYEIEEILVTTTTDDQLTTSSPDSLFASSTLLITSTSSEETASSVEELLEEINEKYSPTTTVEEPSSSGLIEVEYEVIANRSTTTQEIIIKELELEEVEEVEVEIIIPGFEEEIIETQEELEQEIEEEKEETTRDLEEISFFNKIFSTTPALAEEYVKEIPEDLNEFGTFSSAKLKFSMAIRRKSNNVDFQEEVPEEEESEESKHEEIEELNNSEDEEENEPGLIESLIEKILPEDKPEVIEIENEEQNVEITTENDIIPVSPPFEGGEQEGVKAEVSLLNRFINQANAQSGNIKFNIWYMLGEQAADQETELWQKLDYVAEDEIDNFSNNGYYSISLEGVESWEDLEKLQIKLEGLVAEHEDWLVYIDSTWVEVEYNQETEMDKMKKRQRWEEALEMLSENNTFSFNESGELKFQYNKNEEQIWETLSEMIGLGNFWQDVNLEVELIGTNSEVLDLPLTILFEEDGEFTVRLPEAHALQPGQYKLKFYITDRSGEEEEYFEITHDFSWGVLVMNFDKSEYFPDEDGQVHFAVLDESGHTICDATLRLEVKASDGRLQIFSTDNIDPAYRIFVSSECGPESVTAIPDYSFIYQFGGRGDYEFTVTAQTANGEKIISETIEVVNPKEITVQRQAPSRIWPKTDYGVTLLVSSENGFKGDIVETVPGEFKITNYELLLRPRSGQEITNNYEADPFGSNYKFHEVINDNEKSLVWQDVEIPAAGTLEITYSFDAPDRSPEIFSLGSLELDGANSQGLIKYAEKRKWQIASDALNKRARTVMFSAGVYNGNDTAGQNTNTDQSFSTFNWRLAESGVDIRNAFVIFETQFEAYDSSGGNYTGYNLSFDTCEENCTASAWGTGAGQVSENNSNVLAYDEEESNQARLLFDVTSETQIANYTGNSTELESQFGYHIKNGTTRNSIANARAILVVTYVFDQDSENLTNTVVYPLDSDNGTDRGSRQASQGGCTADTNCPTFSYQMEIPEWAGVATSTYRLSQWFKFFDHNDSNNANNLDPYLDIEGYDIDSGSNHYECNNAGTQGNMPGMIWEDWASSGYAENEAQQVEYYINTGNNYMIGGEVFETYIASSSAAEKTRTVSFPIGVITNGNTTAENTGEVSVYFPENGSGSGNIDIKSAWFRVKTHNYNSANLNTQITTTVGTNATTSALTYAYNGGGSVIKPLIDIIHIIPSADYATLETANAETGVLAKVNVTNSAASYDGVSVELMITYTYTDETAGYNTSLSLFGGQSSEAPSTSVTSSAANSVAPESSGKTVYAGGLLASFLNSDSAGAVGAGSIFLLDASIATDTPSCTGAYRAQPDAVNTYTEMYSDVTNEIELVDDQAYTACYEDDESLTATDGAKMNGILTYTYGWTNTSPTSSLLSLQQKNDDSGIVDITIEVDDVDGHDIRLKLEYESGTACNFSGEPSDPSLDETDSNITADHQDPYIENDNEYQIGTQSGYVTTASGSNTVHFDWLAETDLGAVEGDYCFRMTANDQLLDQGPVSTSTVYVDTINPTSPGALSLSSRTGTSITLAYGATTTETNFIEYKIFYKLYDGTDPDENDSVHASTSDINLDNILFNDESTTTITSLTASTTYSFAIWAYDNYGNSSSSPRIDITSNDAPSGDFNSATQRSDGSGVVDFSIEADDLNNHDTLKAKLEYVEGGTCDFSAPLDPELDESQSNISADFGAPTIENDNEYQIGQAGTWILTAPGSNTVDFDWPTQSDLPEGDAEYCLRLTVNDRFDDQPELATTSLTIDNVAPTSTGALTAGALDIDYITLVYATSTPGEDTNEPLTNAYKIFYKQGVSGVTEGDTEIDNSDLDSYDYNSATSVKITGLDENTWYVFNIWTYDQFGNSSSSEEVAIKTNATLNNESLTFINPQTVGPDTNVAIAGASTDWTFRLVISDSNGWYAISSTTLRLATNNDTVSPFNDLAFRWEQTSGVFSETGLDLDDAVTMTGSSTCALNTCTLDFKLQISKDFTTPAVNYNAEVISDADSGLIISSSYTDIYQVRFPFVSQKHYRFRNDDGGE